MSDFSPGLGDYFFKVLLQPEVDKKMRQSTRRKSSSASGSGVVAQNSTSHPFSGERFAFPLTLDDLEDRRLLVQLFDCGKLGEFRM